MTTTTRFATATVLGCVYAALAVWLVSSEGRSYRASLRRHRDKSVATAPVAPSPPATPTPTPTPTHVARTSPVAAPPATAQHSEPPPGPAAGPESPPAANVVAQPPAPPASTAEGSPVAVPAPTLAPAPSVASTPRERSPETIWADSLDLTQLSIEDEARLGAALHQLVLANNPVDRDGDLQRLKRAAAPLLETVSRRDVEYTFTLLDSDEVNAFSLPGGYVYISRGLFHLVGETTEPEQDYLLQFALGHEIAHVDLKHALTLITPARAAATAKGIDTLAQLMAPIAVGYPDALEFAADQWAYQRMTTRLERTRREALMFLVKLQGFSERNGFRNGRVLPDLSSGRTLAENHYRSHPAAWDRLDRLKAKAARPALEEASPSR